MISVNFMLKLSSLFYKGLQYIIYNKKQELLKANNIGYNNGHD